MTGLVPPSLRVLVWNANPTLDVVSVVPSLSPGTVHRAGRQFLTPGGKGTLVVRGLRLLGVDCDGVAPVAGPAGVLVRMLFESEKLPFFTSEVTGMTRVAATIAEESGKGDTVITDGPHTVYGELLSGSWAADPPRVKVASAVGCGDSFLAGMIAGLLRDGDAAAVLRRAVGTGAASAEDMRPGFFSVPRAGALERAVDARRLDGSP